MERQFLIGKTALCCKCKNPFTLDSWALRVKKPMCLECRDDKMAKRLRYAKKAEQILPNFNIIATDEPEDEPEYKPEEKESIK